MSTSNRKVKTKIKGHTAVRAENESPPLTGAEASQVKRFLQHWEIASNGSLIPKAHNAADIGNAERKVRDIYEQP